MSPSTRNKYASRIAKLLEKAEHGATPEEAEVFVAKAQELMTKYAIEEDLVAQARGEAREAKIVKDEITLEGIYRQAKWDITAAVAKANGLKVLVHNRNYAKPANVGCILVGFNDDIERVKMLDASLQIQAAHALNVWWKDNAQDWWAGKDRYRNRREFLFAFAKGLEARLAEANRAAQEEVAREQAVANYDGNEAAAAESVALVVRDRRTRVQDWYDEEYGGKTHKVSRNYARGGGGAHGAGFEAGRRADLGQAKIGQRRRITKGGE